MAFQDTIGLKSKKQDLGTSQGLYNLAAKSGLQGKADKIFGEKGEETKKIFSGGFITDIFDSINALQYGVVGLLKGKGFVEGVRTRQSWSDKDALGEYGIPGMVGGIALDIACDPLTYIAPWTIARKIPGVAKGAKAIKARAFGKMVTKGVKTTKGIKKIETLEGGTALGRYMAEKFKFAYGQSDVYKLTDVRRIRGIGAGTRNVMDLTKPLVEIDPKIASKVLTRGARNRIIRRSPDEIRKLLPAEQAEKAIKLGDMIDVNGKELFKLTGAPMEIYEEWRGKYIANLYEEFEKKPGFVSKFISKAKGISGKRMKKAHLEDLAKRKELGEIKNAPYLLARTNIELIKDIENIKLFNFVSKNLSTDIAQEGFVKLPDTARLGKLKNAYVPEHIFKSIEEITKTKDLSEQVIGRVVAGFKFGKVVMNPATHGRNIISNTILNWWKLGIGPWRVDKYVEGVKELKGKGKWYREAAEQGMDDTTYWANEINSLLTGPETLNAFGKGKKLARKTADMMGEIYQGEEKIAKMTAFIHLRKKGLGAEEAWKGAVSATFDYSQVTPFIRNLRTNLFGFPFITFTYKATPLAVETILKHPGRVSAFGKIKQAIESQAGIEKTAKERASEPSWVRDGFYIKIPGEDEHGRSRYFDLTYIIPFGDLVSGDFLDRRIGRETGVKEGVVPGLARKSPAINLIRELTSNEDFYGNAVFKNTDSSEKQLGDIMRHIVKTYSPPLIADQIPGGYVQKGKYQGERRPGVLERTKMAGEGTQYRTLMQEMARNVGLKVQPIDLDIQETYMEWEKKKAMETLLEETGITTKFEKTYLKRK